MDVGIVPVSEGGNLPVAGGNDQLGRFEFIQLLVAQLSNQDPLEPVENTEFVSQVAQFSSLDELVKIRQLNEISLRVMEALLEGGEEAEGEEAGQETTVPGSGQVPETVDGIDLS